MSEHTSGDGVTADVADNPGGDGLIFIDPGSVSGGGSNSDASDGGTRRRGRKPGTKNKPKEDTASLKGIEIAPILVSIHALLATRFGEHWSMDEPESKQLEKAIKNAMRHQDMMVTQKQLDYAMLAYVIAQVYGTRVVTSVMVARASEPEKPANVTPIRFGA